jgi:hypothetical protein
MTRPLIVDVSRYNTRVDWARLHAGGVRAVFVRVWSGSTKDPTAAAHRLAARQHGLRVFPYFVANPSQDPTQARALAHQLCAGAEWSRLDARHAYWALDWEMPGLGQRWADAFGTPPVLYRSGSTPDVFPAADQWVAAWPGPPFATTLGGYEGHQVPAVGRLVAWQFTDSLSGFADGRLDASLATGRLADHLAPQPRHHPAPPPPPGGGGGHHHPTHGGTMTLKEVTSHVQQLLKWQAHVRDDLKLQETLGDLEQRVQRLEAGEPESADTAAPAPADADSPAAPDAAAPASADDTPPPPDEAAQAAPEPAVEEDPEGHPTGWVPGAGDNPNPADQQPVAP